MNTKPRTKVLAQGETRMVLSIAVIPIVKAYVGGISVLFSLLGVLSGARDYQMASFLYICLGCMCCYKYN